MALYTDRAVFGLAELAAQETGLEETASSEKINLTTKIELAREEVGLELLARLTATDAVAIELSRVVVTTPLRLWQVFHTLEIVYRDAYHNQLNDRYKGKWREYRELSKWAGSMLAQIGVGVAANPVPEAAAPVVDVVAGGLAAGEYFARIAWKNSGGEEGAAGPLGSATVGAGETLRVAGSNPPAGAVEFSVWAGVDPNALFFQATVAVGGAFTASAMVTGTRGPALGQEPTYLRPMPRLLQRG